MRGVACLLVLVAFSHGQERSTKNDWPMLGGAPSRNAVNLTEKHFHPLFTPSKDDPKELVFGDRLLWKKAAENQVSQGAPVVANGKVLLATGNASPRNNRDQTKEADGDGFCPKDMGALYCFEEGTGKFLWQMLHPVLPVPNGWPMMGMNCSPVVDGDRVYYTSNDSVVMCVDLNGMANGNQGVQNERFQEKTDGDVLWSFDLVKHLGVYPSHALRYAPTCSPLIVGDLLFIVTANGFNLEKGRIENPDAPAFLCFSKHSGRLLWKSTLPNEGLMRSQWSSPAYGVFGGQAQVLFPGGDGWLYGLEPETGKLIWKFDSNPKDAEPVWRVYNSPRSPTALLDPPFVGYNSHHYSRNYSLTTPVIANGKIYVATGRYPEDFEGSAMLWCIDPAKKRGDLSSHAVTKNTIEPNPNSGVVWSYGGPQPGDIPLDYEAFRFGRTNALPCIVDDMLYITTTDGRLNCFDARTGKLHWRYRFVYGTESSCFYAAGHIFVSGDEHLAIFKHQTTHAPFDDLTIPLQAAAEAEKQADDGKLSRAARQSIRADAFREARSKINKAVGERYLVARVHLDGGSDATPVVANGVLYVTTNRHLYAVKMK